MVLLFVCSTQTSSFPLVTLNPEDAVASSIKTGQNVLVKLTGEKDAALTGTAELKRNQAKNSLGVPQWIFDLLNPAEDSADSAIATVAPLDVPLQKAGEVELRMIRDVHWKIALAIRTRPPLMMAVKRQLANGLVFPGCIVGLRLGGKVIPFRVSKIVPRGVPSAQPPGAGPAGAEGVGACQVDGESEVVVVPWMMNTPIPRFSFEAVRAQMDSLRSFFAEGAETFGALESLGLQVPLGLLLSGPPGSGKMSLLRHFCRDNQVELFVVSALEIARSTDAPQRFLEGISPTEVVSECLKQAEKDLERPCLIVFVDLDCFARLSSDVADPGIKALSQALEGVVRSSQLRYAGITQDAGRLPARIRKLFHREILLPVPEARQRYALIYQRLSALPLASPEAKGLDSKISQQSLLEETSAKIAAQTNGFVAADIVKVCQMAYLMAQKNQDNKAGQVAVTSEDLVAGVQKVRPAKVLDTLSAIDPQARWRNFAGYESVKDKLRQLVEWPLTRPDAFKTLGVTPPAGVLLYGPSGCGKTKLMTILAAESNINVITLKGSEVISKYVGESEQAIRDLFAKARKNSPCLLLLDEIDSLAAKREFESDGTGVDERVLSTLLNELDGVQARGALFVVASSNRPDKIDEAMLRPGRLDQHLHVRLPSPSDRRDIIAVLASAIPVDGPVDFEALGKSTEGLTGADIETAFREAAVKTLRRDITALAVSAAFLASSLTEARPSKRQHELISICNKFEGAVASS